MGMCTRRLCVYVSLYVRVCICVCVACVCVRSFVWPCICGINGAVVFAQLCGELGNFLTYTHWSWAAAWINIEVLMRVSPSLTLSPLTTSQAFNQKQSGGGKWKKEKIFRMCQGLCVPRS